MVPVADGSQQVDRKVERTTAPADPLDLTVRQFVERVLADGAPIEADPWVDASKAPCGRQRVLDAAKRGELEASKIGRQVLVRCSELDRWIAAQRIEPRPASKTSAPKPTS